MSRAVSRRLILLLGGLSVVARVAAAGSPFADAEAGGGYDGNLNAAATASDARGDGFGFARAALGWIGDGERITPQIAARWNGLAYADYTDLSMSRIAVEGGLRARASDAIGLRVLPSVGGRFYGDSDRDALEVGLLAAIRFEASPRASLESSYAFRWLDARAAVFDRSAHRFALALGGAPWPQGHLRLATAVELGPVVRYLPAPAPGGGGGGGSGSGGRSRPNDTFGPGLLAERQSATVWEVALELQQDLTPHLYLAAGGGYGRAWTDPDDYDLYFGSASLGIRWP